MKERWRFSKEKLVLAEEGLKSAEPVTGESVCSCDRLIQYTKLVLYVELILFLGWGSYTLWQAYDYQAEIRLFNAVRSDRVESSNVPKEALTSSPLKDFEDPVYEIRIKENGPSSEDDILSFQISTSHDRLTNVESTTTAIPASSVKPDKDDASLTYPEENLITKRFETTTASTMIKDSLESSKSDEDNEIMVKIPSLDNSESKETENSEGPVLDWGSPIFWHIHQEMTDSPFTSDSSEEADLDTMDEVLDESTDTSDGNRQMEIQEKNSSKKEESNFSSEDVPSSAEILNNLKKLYESIEAARRDLRLENLDYDFSESSENSKKDDSTWIPTWPIWMPDNVEVPSRNTEESRFHYPQEYPFHDYVDPATLSTGHVESENSDTSKVDETTSELSSETWHPFVNWRGWRTSVEASNSTDESTEKIFTTYRQTSTVPIHDEDSSFMERIWGPVDKSRDDSAISSQLDNVDTGIQTEDVANREPCAIVENFNGFRVVECPPRSVDTTDRSSDSSLTTDFESDDSSISENFWPFFKKESSTEKFNNYEKPIETSTLENAKFEMPDSSVALTIEESTGSSSFGDIWFNQYGEKTTSDEDEKMEKTSDDRMHKARITRKIMRRYETSEDLEESMAKFYSKMETLSGHIDALHERYLRLRKLEDDYVSQEFPNESYEN